MVQGNQGKFIFPVLLRAVVIFTTVLTKRQTVNADHAETRTKRRESEDKRENAGRKKLWVYTMSLL